MRHASDPLPVTGRIGRWPGERRTVTVLEGNFNISIDILRAHLIQLKLFRDYDYTFEIRSEVLLDDSATGR